MQLKSYLANVLVNCRIGSLEIALCVLVTAILVNCRIGSLEKLHNRYGCHLRVNCRIGSLETEHFKDRMENAS